MKFLHYSLVALALGATSSSYADSVAITNATVHTMTEQGTLHNATVVFNDGVISAINPSTTTADITIDATGKILTPGFIGAMNQLGLVEVSAVANTRDAGDDKATITFDASTAFNPKSSLIPYTRKGGITTSVVTPYGGHDLLKGQAFVADLSGSFDSIRQTDVATITSLGAKSSGSRALDIQALHKILAKARDDIAKQASKAAKKDSKDDEKAHKSAPEKRELLINAILSGDKPLVAYADRATDILALLALKKEFEIDLVIAGAGDAIRIASKIAAAEVPLIIGAIDNLPSFDALHKDLTVPAKLFKAGVNVAYAVNDDVHNLYMLRFNAGVSVANGVSKTDALKAITVNVADAFNIDAGRIAVGKTADLVLWSGDPLELSSRVDTMWIKGNKTTTKSRHDALRERYSASTILPRAYVK